MTEWPDLSDWLGPDLAVVSVGLNPSPASASTGVYFANPRNRFWPAMRGAGLVPAEVPSGMAAMTFLYDHLRIGFTDVVKRTTPGASALRAADFRRDAPPLRAKLEDLQPGIVWFHGKVAYQGFCRYALCESGAADWGWQQIAWTSAKVFLTPNPSPANASFSLNQLVAWYAQLAGYIRERHCPVRSD